MKLRERIRAEYRMGMLDSELRSAFAAKMCARYERVYHHVNEAIAHGVKAVIAQRRLGVETVGLRRMLRELGRRRDYYFGLASDDEQARIIADNAEMRVFRQEVRGKSG